MKYFLSAVLLVAIFTKCASPKVLPSNCSGDILDVGVAVKGLSPCSFCTIKKELLQDGFSIVLSDTTYTIKEFRIGYYHLYRLKSQTKIAGNKVDEKNVDFLSKLEPGDELSIECIYIEKDKEISLSTGMMIGVAR